MKLFALLRPKPRRVLAPMPPPTRAPLYPRTRPALLAVPVRKRTRV